jgi:hypothetical protein
MKALVVYESMFGNTRTVAEQIAEGLCLTYEVTVDPVGRATPEHVGRADLLVVGGPTHGHGLSNATSRSSAHQTAARDHDLDLEPDAASGHPGLRSWLDDLNPTDQGAAAAFDTRVGGPALITGRASRGIAGGLELHGFDLVAEPESFLVDLHNRLLGGESGRALEWGRSLAKAVVKLPAGH